jgi:hypothetical protein
MHAAPLDDLQEVSLALGNTTIDLRLTVGHLTWSLGSIRKDVAFHLSWVHALLNLVVCILKIKGISCMRNEKFTHSSTPTSKADLSMSYSSERIFSLISLISASRSLLPSPLPPPT